MERTYCIHSVEKEEGKEVEEVKDGFYTRVVGKFDFERRRRKKEEKTR